MGSLTQYSDWLRTGRLGFDSQQEHETFLYSTASRLWGAPSLLSNGYRGNFPGGVKRPEREADHSTPSSAEVKKSGAILLFLRTSSWRGAELIKHGDNITFIIVSVEYPRPVSIFYCKPLAN
jgi:hypothetical protein